MLVEREASTSGSKQKQLVKPPKRKPGKPITSCAECRRSKLKCDGKVPCSTCVLRGCKSICPDMALSARRKYTYVLEGTDALHDRIDTLVDRVASLEKALQELQPSHSLLVPELLQLKTSRAPSPQRNDPPSVSPSVSPLTEQREQDPEVIVKEELVEALGTLRLSATGESTYFGHTTRTEHLRLSDEPPESYSNLPDSVLQLARGTLAHANEEAIIAEIKGRLPPAAEALALSESFLKHCQYNYGLFLTSRDICEEFLGPIYQSYGTYSGDLTNLGLAFIIFAFGATSFDAPPNTVQRDDYFRLALAISKLSSVVKQTTLNRIRLLTYLANYRHSTRQQGSNHEAWLISSEAMKLAISAGLHINSGHWNLPPALLNERHRVFWSLYMTDTIVSVNVGRPPSLCPVFIDCPIPTDLADSHRWTINFILLVQEVISATLAAKIPPYQEILLLDKKIRDYGIPEELKQDSGSGVTEIGPELSYMKQTLPFYMAISLLLLHKRYLAVALRDPGNLQNHKYMPSVTAIFRTSSEIINRHWSCWLDESIRPIIERAEIIWSYSLLAMVTMCQIATRAPASEFAISATQFLDSAEALLTNASATCPFAAENLHLVRAMRQKASATLNLYRQSGTVDNRSTAILDEVDRIGGKTHLCVNQVSVPPPPPMMGPGVNWDANQFSSNEHENREDQIDNYRTDALERFARTDTFVEAQNMHPSLVHDMGLFAGHSISRAYSRGFQVQDGGASNAMHSGYFPGTAYPTSAHEWHEPPASRNPGLEAPKQGTASTRNPMLPY